MEENSTERTIEILEERARLIKQQLDDLRRGKGFTTYSGRSISEKMVDLIWNRDSNRCVYCGEPGYEIDHVIPYSKGGPTAEYNLVLACLDCNRQKSGNLNITLISRGLYVLSSHGYSLDWVDRV